MVSPGRGHADLTNDQMALLLRLREEGGCLHSEVLRGPDAIALMAEGFAFIENAVLCISKAGLERLKPRSEPQ